MHLKKIEGSVAHMILAGVGTALIGIIVNIYISEAAATIKLIYVLLIIIYTIDLSQDTYKFG